jgi:hypothetical protein
MIGGRWHFMHSFDESGPGSAAAGIHQHHFEASIAEVIAAKRVMRQSLFAGEQLVLREANLIPGATASTPSQLAAYALAGEALLVALVIATMRPRAKPRDIVP